MGKEHIAILEHLLVALAAGGMIGFERSFHGRPAGFRTHTLVCLASSSLMLITLYGAQWFPAEFSGRVALDPTRMATIESAYQVLWNFVNATNLTFSNEFGGSVLAPFEPLP